MANLLHSIGDFLYYIRNQIGSIGIFDLLDIAIVSFLIYYIFVFVRQRRAGKLALGIFALLLVMWISDFLGLIALNYILDMVFDVGLIALIVIFQPELRSALEKMGGNFSSLKNISEGQESQNEKMIEEICLAAKDLSEEKVLIESPFRVISSTTLKKAFPDENFRKYVKEMILGDAEMKDGSYVDLYDDMWGKVTEIDVSGMGISSLRGIEYFPALTSLDASENHITTLDLSGFEKLQTVNVSGQTVDITAAYDREKALFTVSTDILYKEYPRGTIFPLTEEIQTDINFNEMKMDVTFNVSADIGSLSDVNGDGKVNSDDLSYVLCYYGMESSSHEDVNYDGKVNQEDISLLLGNYS